MSPVSRLPAVLLTAVGLSPFAFAGVLTAAPQASASQDDKWLDEFAKTEFKKLEGTWERVTTEVHGEITKIPAGKALLVVGERFFEFGGPDEAGNLKFNREAAKLRAAPKRGDPNWIDLTVQVEVSGDAAAPKKVFTYYGLYKIDGDTLTLSLGFPGSDKRPGKLSTEPGDKHVVDVYKRAKKRLDPA